MAKPSDPPSAPGSAGGAQAPVQQRVSKTARAANALKARSCKADRHGEGRIWVPETHSAQSLRPPFHLPHSFCFSERRRLWGLGLVEWGECHHAPSRGSGRHHGHRAARWQLQKHSLLRCGPQRGRERVQRLRAWVATAFPRGAEPARSLCFWGSRNHHSSFPAVRFGKYAQYRTKDHDVQIFINGECQLTCTCAADSLLSRLGRKTTHP